MYISDIIMEVNGIYSNILLSLFSVPSSVLSSKFHMGL